jgi:hypothetical protein
MSDWNGTAWVEAGVPTSPVSSKRRNWAATILMALGLVALILPLQMTVAGSHRAATSGCSVSPNVVDVGEAYVVSAWGLSTRSAINLWVTENGVTKGEPIGGTTDGTFSLTRSSQTAGVTTYTFSGPTGRNMKIYGSCTVSAY